MNRDWVFADAQPQQVMPTLEQTEMNEPQVTITPSLKGAIVPSDLFKTEGTLHFVTDSNAIRSGGFIFRVQYEEFIFALSFQNNSIVLQRNNVVSVLDLKELISTENRIRVFAIWSSAALTLDCGVSSDNRKRAEVPTNPVAPPIGLLRWARKNNLLEKQSYESEEEFREKVYSCISSINEKINEANAYKSFWNIEYDGQKIVSRKPKKEVELQPLIHCILSDQMLLSNIEVVPEYPTGAGDLDFLFIANVKGHGMVKMCAEVKLAHSEDLVYGLLEQLPAYMEASKAQYGAYCVLSFKGEWFDKPDIGGDRDLQFHLSKDHLGSDNPILQNVRCFIIDLAKPATASRR